MSGRDDPSMIGMPSQLFEKCCSICTGAAGLTEPSQSPRLQ
jgi:hypothetical protein